MKKSLLLILALPLLLSSCEFSPAQDGGNNTGENTNENNNNPNNQNIENEDEEKEESGGNTDSGNNTETGGNAGTDEHGYIGENEENHQENSNISLDEWQEYEFHNGHKPQYNSDWLFFHGDSQEPHGSLWENPNEEVDYSGIEFHDKKQIFNFS